jgi:hypothetical protein
MNKNYEYTVGEDGKFLTLKVAGKKKGVRDINKAASAPYWKVFSCDGIATNPLSGAQVLLNSFELTIYNFCYCWYRGYRRGTETIPLQVYDSMKYLLLAMNSEAYMDLLD